MLVNSIVLLRKILKFQL